MWHLFKNKNGLLEIAFIENGRYIVGSKQGYTAKRLCTRMLIIMKADFYQDDRGEIPFIVQLSGKQVPKYKTEKRWKNAIYAPAK